MLLLFTIKDGNKVAHLVVINSNSLSPISPLADYLQHFAFGKK